MIKKKYTKCECCPHYIKKDNGKWKCNSTINRGYNIVCQIDIATIERWINANKD